MDKRKKIIIYNIISDLLILLSAATAFAIRWARRNYPMNQNRTVYFVMTSDVSGHDSGTVLSIIKGFVLPAIFVFAAYRILLLFLSRRGVNVKIRRICAVSGILCAGTFLTAIVIFKAWRYPLIACSVKAAPVYSEFYEENYIEPSSVTVTPPAKKRNLIVVFMESMESSYADVENGGVFEKTPVPYLQELAKTHMNFSHNGNVGGGINLEGTSWTVAGLLSKLTAVPYFAPFVKKNGKIVCLPNAVSLTDILSEQGYTSIFSIGSEKQFENRDAFFESHSIEVHDINWYKKNGFIPKDYQVFWGFEDVKLYEIAKKELEVLGSGEAPFCYQFLTVDTHFPYGFKCSSCTDDEFDHQMMNVLSCADRQLSDFLQWVQAQVWYENTTVVILGDHCYLSAPKNNFIEELSVLPPEQVEESRHFLNIIINPSGNLKNVPETVQKDRQFSSFDIMPTILEAMGNTLSEDGIALGRSLYRNVPTLVEEYGRNTVETETMRRTVQYEKLK